MDRKSREAEIIYREHQSTIKELETRLAKMKSVCDAESDKRQQAQDAGERYKLELDRAKKVQGDLEHACGQMERDLSLMRTKLESQIKDSHELRLKLDQRDDALFQLRV